MKKHWVGTQLMVEKSASRRFAVQSLKATIQKAKKYADIDALIIWAHDFKTYRKLIGICRDCRIETYLWFPILADAYGYEPGTDDLLVDFNGRRGNGTIGSWEKLATGDEQFLFICPNKTPAIELIFSRYKDLVSHLDIDGVMLDRIRYPSCTNGFESLFTCFCDFCQAKYLAKTGSTLDIYQEKASHFFDTLNHLRRDDLGTWRNLASIWEQADLIDFAKFRESNIFDVVQKFSDCARQRGLCVGLDLYSAFLSPSVSQNYAMLSRICDWIKPMIYCQGIGPACLPLEIKCLWDALDSVSPNLIDRDIRKFLQKAFAFPIEGTRHSTLQKGVSHQAVSKELNHILSLTLENDVQIYPGVVAMHHPAFQVNIDKSVLEYYIQQIKSKTTGFIASWNLPYISDENLKLIGSQFG